MRRIIAYILLMNILLLCMANSALAGGDNYYNYKGFVYADGGASAIVTYYKGKKKKIKIPAKIKGKKVTTVKGFKRSKKVKEMHIPASVYRLYVSSAPALKKITISKKNKYFKVKNSFVVDKTGKQLVSCPGGKRKVKIPNSIATIGPGSFMEGKFKTINLGKNVKKIEYGAFSSCTQLQSIYLNEKLTTIDNHAFEKCKKLKEITLRANVLYVGKGAFWKCTNLEKVEIQNDKQSPEFDCSAFAETKEGITFYVPNKEVAKQLSEKLLCTSIVNAKIYVGNECVYTGITGTEEAWLAKYYEDMPYEMKK